MANSGETPLRDLVSPHEVTVFISDLERGGHCQYQDSAQKTQNEKGLFRTLEQWVEELQSLKRLVGEIRMSKTFPAAGSFWPVFWVNSLDDLKTFGIC